VHRIRFAQQSKVVAIVYDEARARSTRDFPNGMAPCEGLRIGRMFHSELEDLDSRRACGFGLFDGVGAPARIIVGEYM
jgi:hypothetical protein